MTVPVSIVSGDLAHEHMVHTTYDIVHRRLQLEPVKSFFMEDVVTDRGSMEIAEQNSLGSGNLINFVIGQPPKLYRANKNRICALSRYLNGVVNSRTATEPSMEPEKLTICLPEEQPLSFEIILNWTTTHTFIDPESNVAYFYTRIIDAYFLADRLLMQEVCYAILTELHNRAPAGLPNCHGFIYTNTIPGSPLRRFLVGMVVNDPRVDGVFKKGPMYGLYNLDFAIDLKNELVEKLKSIQQPPQSTQQPSSSTQQPPH